MKKRAARIIAMILAIVSLTAMFVMPVSAASKQPSLSWNGVTNGGTKKTFYAQTGKSSNSRKLTVTTKKGELWSQSTELGSATMPVYGAYEVKIYVWNKDNKSWVKEQNYDIYNKSSATITLKKQNATYKIEVWFWRAPTIYNSYWNKNVKCTDGDRFQAHFNARWHLSGTPVWGSVPSFTVKPKSGCSLYSSNPL